MYQLSRKELHPKHAQHVHASSFTRSAGSVGAPARHEGWSLLFTGRHPARPEFTDKSDISSGRLSNQEQKLRSGERCPCTFSVRCPCMSHWPAPCRPWPWFSTDDAHARTTEKELSAPLICPGLEPGRL